MLGYVRADKSAMVVRDYEIYRGVYCSLCNALGRHYGFFGRLLLSYDFAFAAIMKLALSTSSCTFTRGHCPFNPSKKCFFCEKKDEIDACAHATVIIAYYKILDNIHDREFLKRLGSALAFPIISAMHRKAEKKAPEIEEILCGCMKKQAEAEKKADICLDEAADASAEALGRILALGFEGEEKEAMRKTGYYTGRFIYILDAADDLPEDIKSGNFNPFKKEYPRLDSDESRQAFSERAEKSLNLTHAALLESKDSMELRRFAEIAENILYPGLELSQRKVISKYRPEENKSKSFTVK